MYDKLKLTIVIILMLAALYFFIGKPAAECESRGGTLVRPLIGIGFECVDKK